MPEKPEVVTVAKKLSLKLIGKKFTQVEVLWPNMLEDVSKEDFEQKLIGEEIREITTRGKWLVFSLSHSILLIHLRMEGKFFFRQVEDAIGKHEHVIFTLDSGESFRFQDVRKFGKLRLLLATDKSKIEPLLLLGPEVWDTSLNTTYLLNQLKNKRIPMKSILLDQRVLAGIGNIYADEILFLSHLSPLKCGKDLTEEEALAIIENARIVLDKAIEEGGTTIRNYTSEEGVSGLFQNHLYVHQRENEACRLCGSTIKKIRVGGRGTYYCEKCQK